MLIDITDTVQLTHTAAEVDADIDGSVRGDIAQLKDDTWKAQARDNIGAGGGGGSSVTVTPIVTTGTNIADITVDGTTSHLYAPSGGGGGIGRNLLDNPFFTVNQRGQSTYSSSGYSLDRWIRSGTSAVVNANNGYISVGGTSNGALRQRLENLPNGTYELSVKLINGNIYNTTVVWDGTTTVGGDVISGLGLYLEINGGLPTFRIAWGTGYTFDIVAVKLELGSVSTLANDSAPDYATELLKCMRYYYRGTGHPAFGFAHNATTARCMCPVAMRPLNASNPVVYSGTIYINDGAGLHAPTAMALGAQSTASVTIQVTTSGLAAGNGCQIQCNAGAYIELNADL